MNEDLENMDLCAADKQLIAFFNVFGIEAKKEGFRYIFGKKQSHIEKSC